VKVLALSIGTVVGNGQDALVAFDGVRVLLRRLSDDLDLCTLLDGANVSSAPGLDGLAPIADKRIVRWRVMCGWLVEGRGAWGLLFV